MRLGSARAPKARREGVGGWGRSIARFRSNLLEPRPFLLLQKCFAPVSLGHLSVLILWNPRRVKHAIREATFAIDADTHQPVHGEKCANGAIVLFRRGNTARYCSHAASSAFSLVLLQRGHVRNEFREAILPDQQTSDLC
eukprot:3894717-Prymnesium_polylepis.1